MHPFIQAVGMFLGEMFCLLGFKALYLYYKSKDYTNDQLPASISGNRIFNPFIFALPALCDLCSTSIMYIGLNLTYASSFQMIRGSLIIFTSLFSVAFLKRKLKIYQILGIVSVIVGLVVVGLSDVISHKQDEKDPNAILTGDILIILAQISTATQMVLEEKFINSRQVSPLHVVGWEGFFGFTFLSLLCIPMYFIKVGNIIFKNPEGRLEDAIDAFYQIKNNWHVSTGLIGKKSKHIIFKSFYSIFLFCFVWKVQSYQLPFSTLLVYLLPSNYQPLQEQFLIQFELLLLKWLELYFFLKNLTKFSWLVLFFCF